MKNKWFSGNAWDIFQTKVSKIFIHGKKVSFWLQYMFLDMGNLKGYGCLYVFVQFAGWEGLG